MMRLADLARKPEFHLDELLAVLELVPDGESTRRASIQVSGATEQGWEASAAGYFVDIQPDYQCGFGEYGDGKVLTVITSRVRDTEAASMKMQTRKAQRNYDSNGKKTTYTALEWRVQVQLPSGSGEGVNDHLGVAALIAYLRAWGVVE